MSAGDPAAAETTGIRTLGLPRLSQHDGDQLKDKPGTGREVTAQWALWGKNLTDPGYRVLRCSDGPFSSDDFRRIIERYSPGSKETLPQYTICWIPDEKAQGESADTQGESADTGYLAVGIHERADDDPRRSGGLARSARGREIEYLRLFCVRYSEIRDYQASYTELVEGAREHQLRPGDTDGPLQIELPEIDPPGFTDPVAVQVAMLLLTTRPVYILGAEAVTTADTRLRFIDQVMALLPYGMRTTLSASTWASATAMDLKLRLYFTGARRYDATAAYVTWGEQVPLKSPGPEYLSIQDYHSWLERAGHSAADAMAELTDPVNFTADGVRQMIDNLPEDRSVMDIVRDRLERLAGSLRHRDQTAVRNAVKRLKPYSAATLDPAVRKACKQAIKGLRLLGGHPWLHTATQKSVYRTLLRLAFEVPISYASYREIENCADGALCGSLRKVMIELTFRDFTPWLITARAETECTDQQLMADLDRQEIEGNAPVRELQRIAPNARPEHMAACWDFAVQYLCAYDPDSRGELTRLGYLADALNTIFPRHLREQQIRLERILRFVYEQPLGIDFAFELLGEPGPHRTMAFENAVKNLATVRRGNKLEARGGWWKRNVRGKTLPAEAIVIPGIAIAFLVMVILFLILASRLWH